MLLGDHCCVDLMGSTRSVKDKRQKMGEWEKRCCDNSLGKYLIFTLTKQQHIFNFVIFYYSGPVLQPLANLSNADINRINGQITRMPGMEEVSPVAPFEGR